MSNVYFKNNSLKYRFSNIIIYFILPLRILSDTLPVIPTLLNTFLLSLLIYDSIIKGANKKKLFYFLWIFLACVVGYFVAVYFQNNFIYPIRGGIRYGTYVLLFLYFSKYKISLKKLYSVYTFLIVVEVCVCVFQDFFLKKTFSNGTLQNRNHVAYFIALYMAVTLFLYHKTLRGICLFLFEAYLGGLGGTVAGAILLFFYVVSDTKGIKRWGYLFLFFIFVFIGGIILSDRIIEAISSLSLLQERLESGQVGASSSIIWRIVTWYNMINQMFLDGHWFWGAGMEYGSLVSPYFCEASLLDPHNDYVRIYIESGIVGLFIFVFGIFYSLKKVKDNSHPDLRKVCLYFTLAFVVCMSIANLVVQSTLLWFYFIYIGQAVVNVKKEIK